MRRQFQNGYSGLGVVYIEVTVKSVVEDQLRQRRWRDLQMQRETKGERQRNRDTKKVRQG